MQVILAAPTYTPKELTLCKRTVPDKGVDKVIVEIWTNKDFAKQEIVLVPDCTEYKTASGPARRPS